MVSHAASPTQRCGAAGEHNGLADPTGTMQPITCAYEAGGGSLPDNEVQVRIPASRTGVNVVRTLVGDIAMIHDFDLDSVADLRLAVEEACGTLIARATPMGDLSCRLRAEPGRVDIFVTAPTHNGRLPGSNSLRWHILQTLTDSAQYWISGIGARRLIHVHLSKAPSY
jgi:serine/threonine-protein kinase RsbW